MSFKSILCGAAILILAAAAIFFATLYFSIAPSESAQVYTSVGGQWLRSGPRQIFDITTRTFDAVGLFGFAEGPEQWRPLGLPGMHGSLQFVKAGQSSSIGGDEYVFGVVNGGVATAYPLRVLEAHQVANDVRSPQAALIYFGVNSRTAAAYDVSGGASPPTFFKCSGYLYKDVDLLYDTETGSLFSPLTGRFVAGKRLGEELKLLPGAVMRLAEWRALYPDSWLMTENTGLNQVYEKHALLEEPLKFKTNLRIESASNFAPDTPVMVIFSLWRAGVIPIAGETPSSFPFDFAGQSLVAHCSPAAKEAWIADAGGALYPSVRSLWMPAMGTLTDAQVIEPRKK